MLIINNTNKLKTTDDNTVKVYRLESSVSGKHKQKWADHKIIVISWHRFPFYSVCAGPFYIQRPEVCTNKYGRKPSHKPVKERTVGLHCIHFIQCTPTAETYERRPF